MATIISVDKDFKNVEQQNLPRQRQQKQRRPRRRNIFETVMAPQMLTLKIFGFGDQNDFSYRPYRYAYNIYFLIVLGLCLAAAYATYFHTIIKAFHDQYVENILDQFAYFSDELVWVYELFACLLFLIWSFKWSKKISTIFRLMDDDEVFGYFFDDDDDHYVRRRIHLLTIASYTLHFLFIVMALAWPIINFLVVGFYAKIIIYSTSFFPNLFIYFCLSFSTLMYLCTAESWNMFLYTLKKEGDRLGDSRSIDRSIDFDELVDRYSRRYDAMTELTSTVADTFRYYATMHVCAFLSIINLVYQTIFDHTFKNAYKIYNWIDIVVHIIPLVAGTVVYIFSSRTIWTLHYVYKRYHKNDKNQNTSMIIDTTAIRSTSNYREPSPAYAYFYQRVSDEKACLNLDIAGLVAMTKTTVAAFLFAAINWCAVVIQFRQQAPDCPMAAIISNGTNITSH